MLSKPHKKHLVFPTYHSFKAQRWATNHIWDAQGLAVTYLLRLPWPWIFPEPHWKSMGLQEISRVIWQLCCPASHIYSMVPSELLNSGLPCHMGFFDNKRCDTVFIPVKITLNISGRPIEHAAPENTQGNIDGYAFVIDSPITDNRDLCCYLPWNRITFL